MYDKINNKIKKYKVFISLINVWFFGLFIFLIFLFIRDLIFIKNVKIINTNKKISLNIIKNPIIQSNTNKDMFYIISENGIIGENNNVVTLYNTKITSENVYSESKEVFIDNKKDIVILKKRPFVIFNYTN